MAQVNLDNALESGRDAVRRHAWREAFEFLTAADQAGSLTADDLEGLAEAAWWSGRADACIRARERAFPLHLEAGRPGRAALLALALAKGQFEQRNSAVGMAWLKRAEQLLRDPPIGIEHGHLARLQAVIALEADFDFDRAHELATQTLDIGTRFGDPDLMALGLQDQGRALVARGQVAQGMALLDEAAVAALSGELQAMTTGIIYCNLIGTCEGMADYKRAREWTDAARRWCDRQSISAFPGMCRVHRAEVIRLQGSWQEAEVEARGAYEELRGFIAEYAAEALYVIGETRLGRGDLAEARDAFRQAHELGREPNPGLALLRLAEGDVAAAAAAIKRGLASARQPLPRARLLPAQVTIALAANDLATAAAAATELESIASTYATAALKARALASRASVTLAKGDAESAVRDFCEALALWRQLEAPYEEARTRVALAGAYQAGGDSEGGVLELRAANATFARLGAALDERQVAQLLSEAGDTSLQPAVGDSMTRTFMFTDIVKSTALVEAMGDEAWNEVLHWHDQTLRGLIARHAGEEINHSGDGVFASFAPPDRAIECAVQIQRTLADHRRTHGFAPQVRIGLHQAAATRVGLDYRGKGVHEAARIAAEARAGEVLASWHTAQPCKFALSEPREVSLKGIAEPMQVVTISWK
ncbi:MAG TPA: adenylate/guanylate cyclase domain-containing protein [Candidatus Dormibacteraeota bacterium]|nr:adenylate/guanylate cyclase domain-containing protein [Candidatus Dormibacteraeota bacterium]